MYEVYIDGVLRKITKSFKCVDAIIEKFLQNYAKGSVLIVELNGNTVYTVEHF